MNLYKFVSDSIKSGLTEISELKGADLSAISIEVPKDRIFGDFSTNAAMVLNKQLGKAPRQIAEIILPKIKALDFCIGCIYCWPGIYKHQIKKTNLFLMRQIKTLT